MKLQDRLGTTMGIIAIAGVSYLFAGQAGAFAETRMESHYFKWHRMIDSCKRYQSIYNYAQNQQEKECADQAWQYYSKLTVAERVASFGESKKDTIPKPVDFKCYPLKP